MNIDDKICASNPANTQTNIEIARQIEMGEKVEERGITYASHVCDHGERNA